MTTTTTTTTTLPGLTFGGIVDSEWIKLRTLRSTVWCYALIIVVTLGLGLVLAGTVDTGGVTPPPADQQALWLSASTLGIQLGVLISAVLGALVITGEYGTGMIRSTFAAVPARIPAVLAKALVFAVVTFVVGFVSVLGTALVTAPLFAARGIHPDFGDSDTWLVLLGAAGYLTLVGLIAMALGTIIRNSAGGIAAALGLILVVPSVVGILASVTRAEWANDLGKYLPSNAGSRMFSPWQGPSDGQLEPWQAGLVVAAWAVALMVPALLLLKRRDV